MKTCRAMRLPVQCHMNYAILKDFDEHRRASPLTYIEFKQVLRNNNRKVKRLFSECYHSRYVFKR